MIHIFLLGGLFFMLPLLAASIAVIAIAIERSMRYRQAHVDYEEFLDHFRQTIQEQGIRVAREEAADIPGPVARVWEEGLRAWRLPFPLIRERMESTALAEITRLERYLPILQTTAQVAPLVGILGTVWGMIGTFRVVQGGLALGEGVRGEMLAEGIWQALITTAAGLLVAIPALVLFHYLSGRVDRFIEALDRSVADLIGALIPLRARQSAREPVPAGVESD